MDPLSLSVILSAAISLILKDLTQKHLLQPILKPVTDRLEARSQNSKREKLLADAIMLAIEDTAGQTDQSLAIEYFQRIRLHEAIENESIWREIARLVFLATTDDPDLVPDALLTALRLNEDQRPVVSRFLFFLHRHLSRLDDYQQLLQATRDQAVIAELKQMRQGMTPIASTVTQTKQGPALRVLITEPDWNAEPYLRYLAIDCNRLRLSVIDPQYIKPSGENRIALVSIYTDVNVATVIAPDGKQTDIFPPRRNDIENALRNTKQRQMTAIRAVSDTQSRMIVLLGEPGAGKSTFLNYIALCLVMERLEPGYGWLERLQGWTQGKLLPVRIVLGDFAKWSASAPREEATAGKLWDFIQHDLDMHGIGESFIHIKHVLLEQGGLVVLDGLDEVPDAQSKREFIRLTIEDFTRSCGLARFILTCRPYAYREPKWQVADFKSYTIAPFNRHQTNRFIQFWYQTVGAVEGWSASLTREKADELLKAVRLPYLAELSERPLLLTLMATLHTARGKLPDDRADLYNDCVTLLLDYWQHGKTPLESQGIPRSQLESVLSLVAFNAHSQQGTSAVRSPIAADINSDALRKALAPALGNSLDKAELIIKYVEERAGLLDKGQAPDTYAFSHRTFQEFLAACHLLASQDFPDNLASLVREDRDWWREVFLLAVGRARSTVYGQAVALISSVCYSEYHPSQAIDRSEAYTMLLAAQAAYDIRLQENITGPGRFKYLLQILQQWLVGIIGARSLPPFDRGELGRMLSLLGDPRPNVACEIPALIFVPAGEFVMGTNTGVAISKQEHSVSLNAYWIGQYPVTVAQYQRFVTDGGYSERWVKCWTDVGWQWRTQRNISQERVMNRISRQYANHPIGWISWYEATAYCNWLSETDALQRRFRLPTEAEWEKAARGTDGRIWPWGNDFGSDKTNTRDSNTKQVVAVGMFPDDSGPGGVSDVAGNIRQWCNTAWGPTHKEQQYSYPYQGNDGREETKGTDLRLVRGGSWLSPKRLAGCAYRSREVPHARSGFIGFRVTANDSSQS